MFSVPGGVKVAHYAALTLLPVQWGELDATGAVHHMYLTRYAEAGRCAHLDLTFNGVRSGHVGMILSDIALTFHERLHYPDDVVVATRTHELGSDFITHVLALFSVRRGRVVAEVRSRMVSYDYSTLRKTAHLPWYREAVVRLETEHGNTSYASHMRPFRH
jgi:acyl-CoA thioester hydrolase